MSTYAGCAVQTIAIVMILVHVALGGDTPFERRAIDSSIKDPWAKIIADIDKDGFADIVIGGQVGPLAWYRYPDWTKAVISDGGYRTVDGEAGDIDGDGDLDIVMGGLIWYENPLPAASPAGRLWTAHQVADHRTHDIELADLDKDGRLDIVTRDQSDFGAKAGDKVYLWRREADDKWAHKIIECPHGEGVALGDVDRDGDLDVVIGGIWFENDGRILDGAWQAHKFCDWHPSASVEVADVNGDGRPDIVLSPSELKDNWHRLSWFEAPAEPRQGGWTEHVMAERIECVIHGLATADFNGDGSVDIAISEMHQGQDPDEVAIFLNRGKGAAWDKLVLSTQGSHCIQAADIGSDGDIDLMGANWSGPFQPVELWENQSGGSPRDRSAWWNDGYSYRIPVRVGADGFERRDTPVEVPIDFAEVSNPAIRIVEVDGSGRVSGEMAFVQFDQDPGAQAKGTLTFLLQGTTHADAARTFHVYFNTAAKRLARNPPKPLVEAADGIEHEGRPSFRIAAQNATYYYHKAGAGFASMEDKEGNDWLSYNPGDGPVSRSGSGGKYRGIPNMVHPEGHFHPGGDKCASRLLAAGPVKASILSESGDGKWACRWDIFPHHARMAVLKTDHPYWFLYEGTPGGKLDEESDYCVRSDGTRTAAGVPWDGDISVRTGAGEWLYFGDAAMSRVLYLIHHEDDSEIDSYRLMNQEMTVFGFGRQNLNKYMTRVPAHFTIGFCEGSEFMAVSRTVESVYRPLAITVGNCEMNESPSR